MFKKEKEQQLNGRKYIKWSEAQHLLESGDVLLFRGKGIISFLIQRYTGGIHSHAAILARRNGDFMCVEFREFKGSRSVTLESQFKDNPTSIDVFRPLKKVNYDVVEDGVVKNVEKVYTKDVANAVSKDIISWTGQEYGWKNIWSMFKRYIPGLRLFSQNLKDDEIAEAMVCSTAVTVAIRRNYMDPVPYMADDRVSPAGLARSPLLQYLFSIDGTEE